MTISKSAPELGERLKTWARLFMEGLANKSPQNGERLFDEPFFGFAEGIDPIWPTFKDGVGENSWTPKETFRRKFPNCGVTDDELTVAAIVCPQTAQTNVDQKKASGFPSERWTRSRFLHSQVIWGLCDHLTSQLESEGLQALVPDRLEGFSQMPHPRFQITSQWSHRHAAFAAGLGTFGLCDALITKVGKAHRLGSIIIRSRIPPTPRTYSGIYEYCLFHSSGTCGHCARRCPVGALGPKGHNKILCSNFLDTTKLAIPKLWPDLDGAYGCGLCQSAVPCATRRPQGSPRSQAAFSPQEPSSKLLPNN
ncbi:MAG: epoxyqueuosine reductase [Deltaproteobacteria bacterium]|jgi:ferredoxin|nr:epoxyqueuosine reductase [Deltaproteobacteria bacterium]